MKNSNNHIDELFQNGIEHAEIQPPQELWNQISQSWDRVVQGQFQSSSQTSSSVSSTNLSTTPIQGMSAKLGGITQWSSLSKWILGVVGTTVVSGGIYRIAELASPETPIQKINSTVVESNQQEENSAKLNNNKQSSKESGEITEFMGQAVTTAEFRSSNSYIDTQLTVVGSKLNSNNNDGSHVKQELTSPVDQKAAANEKDVSKVENFKGQDRPNLLGVKPYLELIQRNIHFEQIENRTQVRIDGVSELNAIIKSVELGKQKMLSIGNSSYARGDLKGWDLPDEGGNWVFEKKYYVETSERTNVRVTVQFIGTDKSINEKDYVIEKPIEVLPWIAGGIELIPNVFTPNGDGLNDEYYVKIKEPKEFEMTITSAERPDLGTVFVTESVLERWNGKKGEVNCPDGKYWVLLHIIYHTLDRQGEWVEWVKVERILMELKRD